MTCPDCGHLHEGPRLGGICIGCPCPTRQAPPPPRDVEAARELVDKLVPPGQYRKPSELHHLRAITKQVVDGLTPSERAIVAKRQQDLDAEKAAPAGASVLPPIGSVDVNGQHLTFLAAIDLIKAKTGEDIRFLVVPVLDSGAVLLTFGHKASGDQYAFPMGVGFAENFGQLLIQAARQVKRAQRNVPTPG